MARKTTPKSLASKKSRATQAACTKYGGLVAAAESDFPQLHAAGLIAASMDNDGNCLFRAFSDQINGDESGHFAIRRNVVAHMRSNSAEYSFFINVGGERRQPSRSTRNARGSSRLYTEDVFDSIESSYARYLDEMAQPGTWAGQLEITAFAKAYGVNVTVYRCNEDGTKQEPISHQGNLTAAHVPTIHIAFKEAAAHYYSVRRANGPYTGVPGVLVQSTSSLSCDSMSTSQENSGSSSTFSSQLPSENSSFSSQSTMASPQPEALTGCDGNESEDSGADWRPRRNRHEHGANRRKRKLVSRKESLGRGGI